MSDGTPPPPVDTRLSPTAVLVCVTIFAVTVIGAIVVIVLGVGDDNAAATRVGLLMTGVASVSGLLTLIVRQDKTRTEVSAMANGHMDRKIDAAFTRAINERDQRLGISAANPTGTFSVDPSEAPDLDDMAAVEHGPEHPAHPRKRAR